MIRSVNVMFVVVLVLLLVFAFDSSARAGASHFIQEAKPILTELKVEILNVVRQITRPADSVPAEEPQSPPPSSGPVYNAITWAGFTGR